MRKTMLGLSAALLAAGCDDLGGGDATKAAPVPAFSLGMCLTGLDAKPAGASTMPAGGCLVSPSQRFAATVTSAGELRVAAVTSPSQLGAVAWSTKVQGTEPGSVVTAFQEDGNLVAYDKAGKPLWASGSGGPAGAYHLGVSDDGELQIHRMTNGKLSWSSRSGAHADAFADDLPAAAAPPA